MILGHQEDGPLDFIYSACGHYFGNLCYTVCACDISCKLVLSCAVVLTAVGENNMSVETTLVATELLSCFEIEPGDIDDL